MLPNEQQRKINWRCLFRGGLEIKKVWVTFAPGISGNQEHYEAYSISGLSACFRVLPRDGCACKRELLWRHPRCCIRHGRSPVLPYERGGPSLGISVRWVFTYVGPAVHNHIRLPSRTDERRADRMAVLPPQIHAHPSRICPFHDPLQHASHAVGTDRLDCRTE